MSLRSVVLALAVLAIPLTLIAQSNPGSLQGVWKVVEVQVIGGNNPRTNTAPQPAVYIFTKGHYSIQAINADKPRTAIPPPTPGAPPLTDAQKIALYDHWAPFTSNAGTYTVKGTTITTKALVAKNEGVIGGEGQTREFKLEGQTLWLIAKPAAGQPGAEIRTKLTRLE
jgi:Lipocalin-like domain